MSENTEHTRAARPAFVGTLRLKPKPTPDRAPVSPRPPPPPPVPVRFPVLTLTPESEAAIAQRISDLALCRARWPAVFDFARPLPLAIGVDRQLAAVIGADRAGVLLKWWTCHPVYIRAVAAGGARHNLDGTAAGEISAEHRATAARGGAGRPRPGPRPATP